MNTFRITRARVPAEAELARRDRRALIALMLLCPAIFAGFFALGRAGRPAPAQQGRTAAASFPIASRAAIPLRLSSAPSIPVIKIATHHRAPTRVRRAPVSIGASVPSTAPSVISPSPPPASSPSTAAPSAPARQSHPHSGGGVSFESSG